MRLEPSCHVGCSILQSTAASGRLSVSSESFLNHMRRGNITTIRTQTNLGAPRKSMSTFAPGVLLIRDPGSLAAPSSYLALHPCHGLSGFGPSPSHLGQCFLYLRAWDWVYRLCACLCSASIKALVKRKVDQRPSIPQGRNSCTRPEKAIALHRVNFVDFFREPAVSKAKRPAQ